MAAPALRLETGKPVHGTAILVGATGILFTGPSGVGKSASAFRSLEEARASGQHAALIADDGAILNVAGGRVIVSCPPQITGMIEIRGTGLFRVPARRSATLALVIVPGEPTGENRLPPENEFCLVGGIVLPMIRMDYSSRSNPFSVLRAAGRLPNG